MDASTRRHGLAARVGRSLQGAARRAVLVPQRALEAHIAGLELAHKQAVAVLAIQKVSIEVTAKTLVGLERRLVERLARITGHPA